MEAQGLNDITSKEVEDLLSGPDHFFEGLLRSLQGTYPSLAADADDFVAHAVEQAITRSESPHHLRQYLSAVAFNRARRVGKLRARDDSLDVLREGDDFDPVDGRWTVEEVALVAEAYRDLKAEVEAWETGHVRSVTLLYLEAIYEGQPLSSEEAAEIVGQLLDTDISAEAVRTWKGRGFRRLGKYVKSVDDEQGDTE